jgi:pre-mRNA-splicing factor 18
MEALRAEIASKRKAIQDDPIDRPSKYMRRGDLERLREERELAARQVQTSPEHPPSKPKRVSTHSSFKLIYTS